MKEIELKLRIDPKEQDKISAYCRRAGFVFQGELRQTDRYLTPCHKNLFRRDEALRVRMDQAGDDVRWLVTHKGGNTDPLLHSRRELETAVADGNVLLAILEQLDFQAVLQVSKRRRSYSREPFSICLDQVEELGWFVEIEALCHGQDEAALAEQVHRIAGEMGLATATVEPRNYLQLLVEKKTAVGRQPEEE